MRAREAALRAEAADLAPMERLAATIAAAHAEMAAGPKPKAPAALPAQDASGACRAGAVKLCRSLVVILSRCCAKAAAVSP